MALATAWRAASTRLVWPEPRPISIPSLTRTIAFETTPRHNRQAVAKAIAFHGADAVRGAACGSDAFYPFPDAVQVCLDAGVTAFAQPGGSIRDAEVLAVAEVAGAAMLITGVRHFRH